MSHADTKNWAEIAKSLKKSPKLRSFMVILRALQEVPMKNVYPHSFKNKAEKVYNCMLTFGLRRGLMREIE